MVNKTCALFMILFIFLSGCKEKGGDFIGHWVDLKNPTTSYLDINFSDGVYHINVNSFDSYLTLKQKVVRLEGVALSESVLTIRTGLGSVDMRLEGDQIFFEHHTYQKTK